MTIETTTNRATVQLTNDVADEFTFLFPIQAASHVKVYLVDVETRVAELLVLDTDYTLDFDVGEPGGTITTDEVYATGSEIHILRRVPFTQDTDLSNDGGAQWEVQESCSDYLMMAIQDLRDRLDHSFCIAVTEEGTDGGIVIEDFDGETVEGLPGDDGAGYGGTSATSLAIASSGSKAFITQAGMAYVVGSRIRAARTSAPTTTWMEGVVTAYVTTTLTVTMDKSLGAGTHTDWTLSIAGEPGATGATGATGPSGQTITGYSGQIVAPEDLTYTIELYAPAAGTINALRTIQSAGTATALLKINATEVTGTSHSVTTAEGTGTATAANTFVAGDTISLVVSATASAENLAFSIKVTLT